MNRDMLTLLLSAVIVMLLVISALQKKWYEQNLDSAFGRANDIQAEYRHLQSQAIQHGCAHYNPTTGQFQWVETNKETPHE